MGGIKNKLQNKNKKKEENRIKKMRISFLSILVIGLVISSVAGVFKKTLVLVDDLSAKVSHSKFFRTLSERGYDVTVKLSTSEDIVFKKYGEFLYDNLVLMCPETKDFGGDLDQDVILEFVDAGKSLVIFGSANVRSTLRELAQECGVEFDAKGTFVIDHTSYDEAEDDGSHSLIITDSFSKSNVLANKKFSPILYRGIGLTLNKDNGLTTKLVTGGFATYSANPANQLSGKQWTAGSNTVLVSAVQTLGQGRVLVSGSSEIFSDKFLSATVSKGNSNAVLAGNQQLFEQVFPWVLQERGLLRAHSIFHRKQDGSEVFPRTYRVKDDIFFSVVIEEFDGASDTWKPYVANDVQLEFVMLDPYLRLNLEPAGNGTFYSNFRVPDVYGVFKFRIDYRRDGYSHVVISQEIGVRPFRHNEFERFISSAYPYYFSAFSMMGGFLFFSLVFLFSKDSKDSK
eukprot:c18383_g1_i1.p1 GENE.c18383_g1_i1~~c18383_g1_i1.p1  ORF type:complete len:456 (+),score=129.11 c18383_g1_i1:1-1368(+)